MMLGTLVTTIHVTTLFAGTVAILGSMNPAGTNAATSSIDDSIQLLVLRQTLPLWTIMQSGTGKCSPLSGGLLGVIAGILGLVQFMTVIGNGLYLLRFEEVNQQLEQLLGGHGINGCGGVECGVPCGISSCGIGLIAELGEVLLEGSWQHHNDFVDDIHVGREHLLLLNSLEVSL